MEAVVPKYFIQGEMFPNNLAIFLAATASNCWYTRLRTARFRVMGTGASVDVSVGRSL